MQGGGSVPTTTTGSQQAETDRGKLLSELQQIPRCYMIDIYKAAFDQSSVGTLILQRKGPEEFVILDANPVFGFGGRLNELSRSSI